MDKLEAIYNMKSLCQWCLHEYFYEEYDSGLCNSCQDVVNKEGERLSGFKVGESYPIEMLKDCGKITDKELEEFRIKEAEFYKHNRIRNIEP